MSKFKVGDRVKIVSYIDYDGKKWKNCVVGNIGIITTIDRSRENTIYHIDHNKYCANFTDNMLELVEETPKKIAVKCDTIEEWKAVLDKLFSEGKRWITGSDSGYSEEDFRGVGGDCDCICIRDNFYIRDDNHFKSNDYTIIQAKEYLGKDVNEKVFNIFDCGETPPLTTVKLPNWIDCDRGTLITLNDGECVQVEVALNKKPNKIKKLMNETKNSIVDFAKNLSLSSEEKVLREVGLKDSDGDWNTEALDISLDLEAVSLGFKSAEEMSNFVPAGCELSKLEVARLLKKYEAQLLEIVKKMKEETKGVSKK